MKQEPSRGTPDRVRAVRAHVDRVIRIFERHHPVTAVPVELAALRTRDQPECDCEESKPRAAHGTFLCILCGGVTVPSRVLPSPNDFPKDDLGNTPVAVRDGVPIVCTTCKAENRTVYARFAKKEQKLWCPVCHVSPQSESFTRRLLGRKPRKVHA